MEEKQARVSTSIKNNLPEKDKSFQWVLVDVVLEFEEKQTRLIKNKVEKYIT